MTKQFTVFSNADDLLAAGAKKFKFGTQHYWFDRPGGVYDTSHHSPDRTRLTLPANSPSPLVIDIEAWPLNDETRDQVRQEMQSVANTVREINPGIRIGWYRFLPIRNYWTPKDHQTPHPDYQRWRNENKQNIRHLAHLFDFLAPSLYSFYPDHTIDDWKRYADGNLRECVPARKQNYAYVWPTYHDGSTPVPLDMWRQQLQYLRDHRYCDGVFIFDWNSTHEGWREIVIEELLYLT